jgi:hypothetical protein
MSSPSLGHPKSWANRFNSAFATAKAMKKKFQENLA